MQSQVQSDVFQLSGSLLVSCLYRLVLSFLPECTEPKETKSQPLHVAILLPGCNAHRLLPALHWLRNNEYTVGGNRKSCALSSLIQAVLFVSQLRGRKIMVWWAAAVERAAS